MGITKSFLCPYSIKENGLDHVERNYTKYPEPFDRVLQKKENQKKKNTEKVPPFQSVASLSYTSLYLEIFDRGTPVVPQNQTCNIEKRRAFY